MSGRTELPRRSSKHRLAAWAAAATFSSLAATLAGHSRVTTRLSWHADIRPIVERHCLSCHTGRDATVPLDTYQDARPWVRAIREEVLERRMPPWYARPGAGRFANERRLSPVEIELLVAWADGGAPEGKPVSQDGGSQPAALGLEARARDQESPGADGTGPERGLILTPGVSRARATTRWTALVPHCPTPLGSLSVSIEPRDSGPRVLLEVADVSKAGARDPYRFSDPVPIRSGTPIVVRGSAGCSAIAMIPLDPSPASEPRSSTNGGDTHARQPRTTTLTSLGYWCPMHPDVQSDQPGSCRRCSMALVSFRVDLSRRFDWTVEPHPAPRAGRPTSLALAVRERGSATLVDGFERVHEQEMHVFIVSEDRERFDHVHPQKEPNGRFTLDWTPPQAGRYKVYGDFLPRGGSPQMLQELLVVGGPSRRNSPGPGVGPLEGRPAAVGQPGSGVRVGVRARLESESAVSGDTTRMTVVLEDSKTGQPVADLEPYLGSAGHMFVVSSDLDEGLHAHPDASDEPAPARQAFDVRFPRPGWWNVWLQVKRRNEVLTFPFAVEVRPKA